MSSSIEAETRGHRDSGRTEAEQMACQRGRASQDDERPTAHGDERARRGRNELVFVRQFHKMRRAASEPCACVLADGAGRAQQTLAFEIDLRRLAILA